MKSEMHKSLRIHPGEFLKRAYIDELDMSMTEFAVKIGVSSATIARLVSGKASLSVDMAMRLSKALSTSPDLWLDMQTQFDVGNYDSSRLSDVDVIWRGSRFGV